MFVVRPHSWAYFIQQRSVDHSSAALKTKDLLHISWDLEVRRLLTFRWTALKWPWGHCWVGAQNVSQVVPDHHNTHSAEERKGIVKSKMASVCFIFQHHHLNHFWEQMQHINQPQSSTTISTITDTPPHHHHAHTHTYIPGSLWHRLHVDLGSPPH